METIHMTDFETTLNNFVSNQKELDQENQKLEAEMKPQIEKIQRIQADMTTIKDRYQKPLDELEDQKSILKQSLETQWDLNEKTIHKEGYIVQRRDLKRLQIVDPTKMVTQLNHLGKMMESVKKWDEKFILKLCEAGVMPAGAAEETLKMSISCRMM